MVLYVLARPWSLGTLLAQYLVLLRRQLRTPLLLTFLDLGHAKQATAYLGFVPGGKDDWVPPLRAGADRAEIGAPLKRSSTLGTVPGVHDR